MIHAAPVQTATPEPKPRRGAPCRDSAARAQRARHTAHPDGGAARATVPSDPGAYPLHGSAASPFGYAAATHRPAGLPPIQAKLSVGAPDDAFEREADRVADQVMQMPGGPSTIQRTCAACDQKDDERIRRKPVSVLDASVPGTIMRLPADDDEFLASLARDSVSPDEQAAAVPREHQGVAVQAKPRDKAGTAAPPDLAHEVSRIARRDGAPISNEARSCFEPRFGYDFSEVRIHTGGETARVAEGLRARAFTLGKSIFFGEGEYQPHTQRGQHLLAHELTHVLQQAGAAGTTAMAAAAPGRIQRTPAETRATCPPYFEWDRSQPLSNYNCAGLAFRTYDDRGNLAAERTAATGFASIPCGSRCRAGDIKHWFWEYDIHLEAGGIRLTADNHDFHTVAGMIDPRGAEPTDVYTKNGHRAVHGPGTGAGFRPLGREQALSNDASETPATVDAALSARIGVPIGTPIMKVRSGYTDTCGCAQCPGFVGPPQLPP